MNIIKFCLTGYTNYGIIEHDISMHSGLAEFEQHYFNSAREALSSKLEGTPSSRVLGSAQPALEA